MVAKVKEIFTAEGLTAVSLGLGGAVVVDLGVLLEGFGVLPDEQPNRQVTSRAEIK